MTRYPLVSHDPVDAFREAAAHPRMFWLDGGGSRAWSGRRSLVGWLEDDDVSLTYDAATREVSRHRGQDAEVVGDDVFAALEEELGRDPGSTWVGYFGYACRPDLPARVSTEPPHGRETTRTPDAVWMRARHLRTFSHPPPELSGAEGAVAPPPPDKSVAEWYGGAFDRVQEQLRLGNSYEVNLTYRESVDSGVDPVAAYLRLRTLSPAPYAGFLRHGAVSLLSSSPERFATVDGERWVETRPIKGTSPRGSSPAEDRRNREALRRERRYRAENLMIVDLLRNDLSMVCEPGTVSVPSLMRVESYAGVHQLVSTVRGRLREGVSTLHSLRALFPAGSMTGAPKLRTMEIIADVETTPRGVYSGAFGWVAGDGRADLGVVIRTLVSTTAGEGYRYVLGTGGGVTVHSEPASELEETRWKAARLRAALDPDAPPET